MGYVRGTTGIDVTNPKTILGGATGFMLGGPAGAAIGAGLASGSGGKLLGGLTGGNTKTPDSPDYLAAARATAAGNHTSQYTPYGSLVYTQNPNNPDQWSAQETLAPAQQQLLDQNNQLSLGMFSPEQSLLSQAGNNFSQPFQGGSDAARQQAINSQYGFQASRLDPQWQQNREQLDSQLANQGIAQGSQAYTNAMRDFGNQENDAYSQARNSAIQMGNDQYNNTFNQNLQSYELPLNMLNSMRSGSQTTNPNFINTPSGTDALQAAGLQNQFNLGLYNSQVGQQNSLMNGLFGLGAAGLMKYSDRRLKSNIKLIGKYKGHNFYNYDISGRNEFGVMAQEVLEINPSAVIATPSGYLAVNYGAL